MCFLDFENRHTHGLKSHRMDDMSNTTIKTNRASAGLPCLSRFCDKGLLETQFKGERLCFSSQVKHAVHRRWDVKAAEA